MVRIGVTSISFSKNAELCRIASEIFPEVRFNAQGLVRSEDDVISFLQSCDGAIVGTEPVSERVLDALPDLQMIAKYGVGLDSIDLEAMARRGIALGWTGGVNRRSVSELALCLMLMLSRNVSRTSAALARGSWQKDGGRLLSGRSIGIVGCGFVGEDLLELLSPLGGARWICDIEDRSAVAQRFGAGQVPYEELLQNADVVSFHVPLTSQTRHMLGPRQIDLLRPGAIVINTSRGGVIDQAALKEALKQGRISAGLDVFAEEPARDLELLALPNLVGTPHVGGNAAEAVQAMGLSALRHLTMHFGRPFNY